MITYRVWEKTTYHPGKPVVTLRWDGWFLLGFIPVYVRQQTYLAKG